MKTTIQELLNTPLTNEDISLAQKAFVRVQELADLFGLKGIYSLEDIEEWAKDLAKDLSKFKD